jgi:hypothetical protein
MICLANSWREHGRCVAGIRQSFGKWIRPVPKGGGAIPAQNIQFDGGELAPLDVVEMRVRRPAEITHFQFENREILDWDWEIVDTVEIDEVMQYCSKSPTVLHNHSKVIEPSVMNALRPEQWVSLQLVHAKNVIFRQDPRNDSRWVAEFSLSRFGPDYQIKVTDPIATERLNAGGQIGRNCLLTVSLTEPIALYDLPELCYKVVAAVIEVE